MTRFVMLISTNAVKGREEEYNAWYDDRHLPDVLGLDGVVSAQRFRLADTRPEQPAPHRYLALYEVDADSAEAAGSLLTEGFASGRLPLSEALDRSSVSVLYYEPITDRRTG